MNSGGIWVNASNGDCKNNNTTVQVFVPNSNRLSAGGTIQFKCRSFSGSGASGRMLIAEQNLYGVEYFGGGGRISLISTGTKDQFTGQWTLPSDINQLNGLEDTNLLIMDFFPVIIIHRQVQHCQSNLELVLRMVEVEPVQFISKRQICRMVFC